MTFSNKDFLSSFQVQRQASNQAKAKFAEIDQSVRLPVLMFTGFALVWLLIGTLFALLASIALHSPHLLPNWECLSTGIVRSAHLNSMAYGWANNAVYALATWMMLRLCKTRLVGGKILIFAGILWNFAVFVGVCAILCGQLTSVEWLEMPRYLSPILGTSYLLIGVWSLIAFWHRQSDHVYVSQWYILGALFWFPWIYIAAQMVIFWFPAQGVIQPIANWWFGHNALGLWYTPIAVAVAYYLIPKVLGKPIHSYYLSLLGFWTLALFYNWAGMHHLIGGPIPAWVISAGTVASVMMVIPVVVTAINHHFTVIGSFRQVWQSPTLRFIVFGAMSYTLVSFIGSAMALREVNEVTHFTHFTVGHAHHGAYAFFTMIMFGGIYYMLPRLLKREWPSALLIHIHFWGTALGITIYVTGLSIGGWIQGLEMNNPDIAFIDVVRHTIPWLISRTVGGSLLAIGHVAFFTHFVWMLFSRKASTGPTLFVKSANK